MRRIVASLPTPDGPEITTSSGRGSASALYHPAAAGDELRRLTCLEQLIRDPFFVTKTYSGYNWLQQSTQNSREV
jgi:hypothetical protein